MENDIFPAGNNMKRTIEFTKDEVTRMKKTKEIDQLVDVAGSIIKRKLAERKQEAEQAVDGNPH